jgi:hypothetical protein
MKTAMHWSIVSTIEMPFSRGKKNQTRVLYMYYMYYIYTQYIFPHSQPTISLPILDTPTSNMCVPVKQTSLLNGHAGETKRWVRVSSP